MRVSVRTGISKIPFFLKCILGLIILNIFGVWGIKKFVDPTIPPWVYGTILILINIVVVVEVLKEGTEIELSLNPFRIHIKKGRS